MPDIFGGLWLENLVAQDRYYELMRRLLEESIIQGTQLRVAHPNYTPKLSTKDFKRVLANWPGKLLIHVGAENAGVDLGEQFDETGEFQSKSGREDWTKWNKRTFDWALRAAMIRNTPLIAHPGYGINSGDKESLKKIVRFLRQYNGQNIAIENVPPIVDKRFWGFGGTPQDMKRLFRRLGTEWKCLIDWTHLKVTHNQANSLDLPELQDCKDIEKLVEGYLSLPHLDVCHYSGSPPSEILAANHGFFDRSPLEPILEAMKKMGTVCLEIQFGDFDKNRREIEDFKNSLE